MASGSPNFSPFPFARLQRVTRREAALSSVLARWISSRPLGARCAKLAGGPVTVELRGMHSAAVGTLEPTHAAAAGRPGRASIDPHAAIAEVRIAGAAFVLAGSSRPVRSLAQRLLGGPTELAAPRPLSTVEHAIWALALATAIEDMGLAAEVWPLADLDPDLARDALQIELTIDLAGTPCSVVVLCPRDLELRVPPVRALPAWPIDMPVVVGSCAVPRDSLSQLAIRDVITLDGHLALWIGDGTIGLAATTGAVEAKVTTGYGARDMALPDEAHVELVVQLGTTRLTLRQLGELAPGAIVALGRPLAGPYEVRAAGRLIGQGELVDVDGEVGVRIVSLQE